MEENLLFTRTFLILGGMLLLTTITARINKAYETTTEQLVTTGGTFISLFVIYAMGDHALYETPYHSLTIHQPLPFLLS